VKAKEREKNHQRGKNQVYEKSPVLEKSRNTRDKEISA